MTGGWTTSAAHAIMPHMKRVTSTATGIIAKRIG